MKTALILGVSGQDGAYLSRLLLEKRYAVHGTSRGCASQSFARLHALDIRDRVVTHDASMSDRNALRRLIVAIAPDEIYNLTGPSSVAQSFTNPNARISIADGQLVLLDAIRGMNVKVYHSASSDCFGDCATAADESTPFAPRSPYAAGKADAHDATRHHRDTHGLFAVSGIVFNHESPLRGDPFVTRKIIAAAASGARLTLGDTSVSRDWGYAEEYVEAMWRMLQQDVPEDYVICTGESHTVAEFAEAAFAEFDRDHRDHVTVDPTLFRPSDIHHSRGNPARALARLGWKARTKFRDLVRLLASATAATTLSV